MLSPQAAAPTNANAGIGRRASRTKHAASRRGNPKRGRRRAGAQTSHVGSAAALPRADSYAVFRGACSSLSAARCGPRALDGLDRIHPAALPRASAQTVERSRFFVTRPAQKNLLTENTLRELSNLKDDASRSKYLSRRTRLRNKSVVQQLNDVVRAKLREDPHQALALAEAAVAIARKLHNRESLGRGLRSKANALYMIGDNQKALDFHAQALEIFQKIGNAQEEARTLIPSIQPLILLGQYDRAFDAAQAARKIFERLGDKQRLGHLESTLGIFITVRIALKRVSHATNAPTKRFCRFVTPKASPLPFTTWPFASLP